MADNRHYPNISQAIWLLTLLLLLMAVLAILFGIVDTIAGFSLAQHPAALAAIWLIATGPILRRGLKKSGASFRAAFPLVPMRPALLLPMAMTIFGTSILVSEMDNLLRTFLPAPSWFIDVPFLSAPLPVLRFRYHRNLDGEGNPYENGLYIRRDAR